MDHEPILTPDEAALAWFTRLRGRTGAPNAAERAAFEQWLAASPSHRAAWGRAESLWSATGEAGMRAAEEEAPKLAAYLDRIDRARRKKALRQTGAALGLAFALLAGAVWLERPHLFQDFTADHVSARGERQLVALPDGSTALLNADTALDEDYSAGERRVRLLRGTTFFSVMTTGTPFVVEAADGEVRVLGTQFDVRLDDGGATVTLAKGRVEVVAGGTEAILAPGQQVRFAGRAMSAITDADLDTALAWRDGRIVFYEARLGDVVAEIARYRPGRIVIAKDKLADWLVSGSLPLDDPDAALKSLQATVGFSMRSLAGRLVVLN